MLPGVGHITARKILQTSGSSTEFFNELKKGSFKEFKQRWLRDHSAKETLIQAEREIENLRKHNITCLTLTDADYPRRLNACEDGPIVLYCRGEMDLNAPRFVALVGTRKATPYGIRATEELIDQLNAHNCTLISGLAYGIDTAAHRAARDAGIQNIAALAHGLDRVYPSVNKNLARSMEKLGGLVSDFPTGTKPDRVNFPIRNRIIAGLADAVVVVEAATSGGALITADIATSYHRDVFAVPGRVNDDYSNGCNLLIRNNRAAILTAAKDLSWHLGWKASQKQTVYVQSKIQIDLSENEELLLKLVRQGVQELDQILRQTEMPINHITASLLSLEFKGMLKALPGKIWQITGNG
jgi:DNA processing protein